MNIITTLSALVLVALIAVGGISQDRFAPDSIRSATMAPNHSDVFVRGTIKGYPESDEVVLQDATGVITVDLDERHLRLGLPVGTSVLVLGEIDRDGGGLELDADHVWRARSDLSNPALKFRSLNQAHTLPDEYVMAVRGKVLHFHDRDEIIVEDEKGTLLIDLDVDHHLALGIRAGDTVEILGEVDADFHGRKEIDALVIRKTTRKVGPVLRAKTLKKLPVAPRRPAQQPKVVNGIQSRLTLLKRLHDEGLITEEEYANRKAAILAEI